MKSSIILIGYMGCGKSTLGKKLASLKKLNFCDTDLGIEKQEGRSISEIFAREGESYFRNLETKFLQKMKMDRKKAQEEGRISAQVISVGGGLPVREENRILLRQLGKVVYLKAGPDTLYERLKTDTTRPLLQSDNPREKIREMLESREDKYQAAADCVIEVDGKTIEEVIEILCSLMEEE